MFGAALPERLTEVHVALRAVSAQPAPRVGGVPRALPRDRPTRWRVTYAVTGSTLVLGATRWRFRSARVTQIGVTTWQYVAPVPRWFPRGGATLQVEVHLTVRGRAEELTSRSYDVQVR